MNRNINKLVQIKYTDYNAHNTYVSVSNIMSITEHGLYEML